MFYPATQRRRQTFYDNKTLFNDTVTVTNANYELPDEN